MAAARSESGLGVRSEPVITGPKLGRPTLKHPTFDKGPTAKYTEYKKIQVKNKQCFQIINVNDTEKYQHIKNWLGDKVYIS